MKIEWKQKLSKPKTNGVSRKEKGSSSPGLAGRLYSCSTSATGGGGPGGGEGEGEGLTRRWMASYFRNLGSASDASHPSRVVDSLSPSRDLETKCDEGVTCA